MKLKVPVATFSLIVLSASFVLAADPPGFGAAPGAANANEITEFKGELQGFQNGVLLIKREDGKEVMVKPPTNLAMMKFNATAKPAFLRRGMLVRFSGSFQPNGVAVSPVNKVEIFQAVNPKAIVGHARELFTPGVHPHDKHAKNKVGPALYTVVGALQGINSNGAIMVRADKIPVTAPLAQTATFSIAYNNLSLAQPGDPVTVAGFYNPPDDTKIRGDRITITTDRVYGEPVEKPVPKRRSRRKTSKDDPDPAAEKANEEEKSKTNPPGTVEAKKQATDAK